MTTTLFHSARKLDAAGEVDDFWMLVDGDTIVSTGHGRAWVELVESGLDSARPTAVIDVGGKWLVPGFIDLHGPAPPRISSSPLGPMSSPPLTAGDVAA